MPAGNKQMYGKGYIMGQMSKQGEMSDANESALYREGLEFDTRSKTDVLTEDMPKKLTKPTDTGLMSLADDNRPFAEGGK